MAEPTEKKTRKRRATPPKQEPQEWPVDADDVERLADSALDEPAFGGDLDFVRGGSDEDEGFSYTIAEARSRAARLAAGVPDARDLVSARRRKAFLMALATTGNVTIACAAAGWPRSFPYSLRKADKEFGEQWGFCVENAADLLEGEALRRAVHGVREDVWYKPKDGSPEVIGHKVIYSDRLLETLLKANKPEKFNPSIGVKVEGNKGGVLMVPAAVPLDEWSAAAYRQQAQFREKREED
jgi:hypothetical protein